MASVLIDWGGIALLGCFPGEPGLAEVVDYFYAKGDEQHGPLTAEQFAGYVRSGVIDPGDLVWRTGLETWQPLNVSGLDTEVRAKSPTPGADGSHAADSQASSATPAPVNPYGTPSPPPYPMAPPASSSAILSLVMGILGLPSLFMMCPVFSIVAVVSGHIALAGMKANPGEFTGRGLAVAGLILGYLGVGLGLLMMLMFVPFFIGFGAL